MQNECNFALKEITYEIAENGAIIKRKSNYFLYFIAAVANLLSFGIGCTQMWITPVISKIDGSRGLEQSPFDRPLTSSEIALLAGLIPGGATMGNFITGKLSTTFGRKKPLVAFGFILMCSYLITGVSRNIYLFYFARFLAGLMLGCAFPAIPVFLTEIAEVHNRGALGCSMAICIGLGMNFTVVVGPYLSVSSLCLVMMSPLLIFVLAFGFLSPETPIYLASINNSQKLASSLQKLRNKSNDEITEEMAHLLEITQQDRSKGRIQDLYKDRVTRKSVTICLILCILQQASSFSCLISYLQIIFDAAKSTLPTDINIMIVGFCQLIGMLLSLVIVDKAGRRILLLISTFGVSLSLITLGIYFYLVNHNFDVSVISWLPVVFVSSFTIFFGVGLGPVVWLIGAEILPTKIKSIAMGLMGFCTFATAFATVIAFPTLIRLIDYANSFMLFAFVAFLNGIYVYFVIPETKGKNLQEIQTMLATT